MNACSMNSMSGEAVAAEHGGSTVEVPWLISLQVKLRRHAVHRVDHASELRHEERVHARSRRSARSATAFRPEQ